MHNPEKERWYELREGRDMTPYGGPAWSMGEAIERAVRSICRTSLSSRSMKFSVHLCEGSANGYSTVEFMIIEELNGGIMLRPSPIQKTP